MTPSTLRRTIARTAVAVAAAVLVGVTLVYVVTDRMMDRVSDATDRFIEEQQVADGVGRAVVRQLVAASTGASRGDPEARRAFNQAGDSVYGLIQDYIFRTLSADERLQLERVKRAHQQLEVSAVRAADLEARGDAVAADAARTEMFDHASALLASLEMFIGMREQGLERIRAEQSRLVRALFLLTGLAALSLLAASLMAGRFLYRRVSLPLARLAETTSRIGEGDLDARIEAAHDDEIGALAESFNRMAESLTLTRSRLEARNEELAAALTKIHETQAELVQAEKMSALGRMMAGLTHELNNPLASVLAHAELLAAELADGNAPGPEQLRQDFLEPLLQEGRRTRDLVQNLLGFSRKSEDTLGPVPLRASLDVAIGLRRYAFEREGLSLTADPIPDIHVRAERQRLQDAFLNIINNALDAMLSAGLRSGELRMSGAIEDGMVRLLFDDDGPGFTEPDRVFEPFYTTKPVGEGTGLGLALVHRFVRECGGAVVATEAPGGGARIVLELPACDAPAALDASVPTRPPVARRPAHPGPADGARRVLVVEDEPHLRRVQERLLLRIGVRAALAASAAEARKLLECEEFDAVVTDVRMPHESGVELYRWLQKAHPALASRVLFVTGDVYNRETRELAFERPELFVRKPFEMEEYLAKVAALLDDVPVG